VLSFLACSGVRRDEVMDPHATVPAFLVAKVEINGNLAQGYREMTFPQMGIASGFPACLLRGRASGPSGG
jgi:hypothetical protein